MDRLIDLLVATGIINELTEILFLIVDERKDKITDSIEIKQNKKTKTLSSS